MSFKQIHSFFPFIGLLKLLSGLAFILQGVLILYNHFYGYHVLESLQQFFFMLFIRTLVGLMASFIVAYPFLFVIRYLNKTTPWNKNVFKRIATQLSLTIIFSVIVSSSVTLFIKWRYPSTIGDFESVINNAMIYIVANIILMSILEGWLFFVDSRKAKQEAEKLSEELSQIKFEVLKSQINPHFMFNSLNVLSGLINKDVKKAQLFIDEFSHIYRYVLEMIEQPVATVNKELDFARSYLFLQQIRYGNDLSYTINIPADLLELLLPPLSLQVVLENATKHNIVNETKPLRIEIFNEGFYLVIKNNIQPKISREVSTGLGLKNLVKRYAMISDKEPLFLVETIHYIAKLPLIKPENDERINY